MPASGDDRWAKRLPALEGWDESRPGEPDGFR